MTMVLLLGSNPPSEPLQELPGEERAPGLITPAAEQLLAMQECRCERSSLTLEAFSRMAPNGAFSVWELTEIAGSSAGVEELRRFIGYYSLRSPNPSQTRALLLVELTFSRADDSELVTQAQLAHQKKTQKLQIWRNPASQGEPPGFLLEGAVDIQALREHPHELIFLGGETGAVRIATLTNIRLR